VLDLAEIVAEAERRLSTMIEEHEAQITTPVVWPAVLGYAPWVEEVWVNYLSNAMKYGGQPPTIEIGSTPLQNGTVRCWVKDNGPGLTPEQSAGLFCAHLRLRQVRADGHGLGLSIVRRIVENWRRSAWRVKSGREASLVSPCPVRQLRSCVRSRTIIKGGGVMGTEDNWVIEFNIEDR
jgi:signal transduction histidine kinase